MLEQSWSSLITRPPVDISCDSHTYTSEHLLVRRHWNVHLHTSIAQVYIYISLPVLKDCVPSNCSAVFKELEVLVVSKHFRWVMKCNLQVSCRQGIQSCMKSVFITAGRFVESLLHFQGSVLLNKWCHPSSPCEVHWKISQLCSWEVDGDSTSSTTSGKHSHFLWVILICTV